VTGRASVLSGTKTVSPKVFFWDSWRKKTKDVKTKILFSASALCLQPHFLNTKILALALIVWPHLTGFVQTPESPGIKMLRFPGLESPGKRHRSWKTLEF